jgi:t-SNARE complex subunit (syntaxin)
MPRIPSYLGWAIAVLILCFWPTGIAAVVYASQVDNKVALGDIQGAMESSRKAKTWCWVTFGIAAAFWVIGIAIAVIVAIVGAGVATFTY